MYVRIIMPLINESKGYDYKGRTPAGRCLLESRSGSGKLMLWIQDLKPEAIYHVNLIFREEGNYAGLPLCTLNPSPNGKAELRYLFDAGNIAGFGKALDDCLAVAIVASGGSAPLCAYKDAPLSWRGSFRKLEKNGPPEPVPMPLMEKEPEMAPIEVSETAEEVPEESDQEKQLREEEPYEEPPYPEEPHGEPPRQEEPHEEPPRPEESHEEPPRQEESPEKLPEAELSESMVTDVFEKEVEAILKSHTHMRPFKKQNRSVNWVRISLDEGLSLPDYIRDLLSEPFVEAAYSQYNHLILGKAADDGPKRYYIGVPALYSPGDKLAGFRQFKCSEDTEPSLGDYGYWLIFMS